MQNASTSNGPTASPTVKVRVLIVDDDPFLARSLGRLLDLDNRFEVVGTATSGPEALAQAQALNPDLVLMDVRLPGLDGIETTRRLRQASFQPQVVMLTAIEDDDTIHRALAAGASGYVVKDTPPVMLAQRVADALDGGAALSPRVAKKLLGVLAPTAPPPTEHLAPREQAVLEVLAEGASYAEVGRRLGISAETVRTYVKAIYRKLKVTSKTEAVMTALRAGLIARPR